MPQRTSKYPPKTLVNLTEVRVFAATYVDPQQFSDTRFVAVIGENVHFLHPENVDNKIRQPAKWLKDQVKEKIEAENRKSAVTDGPIEIPEDADVTALPTGSDTQDSDLLPTGPEA